MYIMIIYHTSQFLSLQPQFPSILARKDLKIHPILSQNSTKIHKHSTKNSSLNSTTPTQNSKKHIEIRHWRSFHRCLPGRSVGETAIHHAHLALRSTAERWGSAVCGPPAGQQRSTGKKVGWGWLGAGNDFGLINPLSRWVLDDFPIETSKNRHVSRIFPSYCAFFVGGFSSPNEHVRQALISGTGEALGDSHILVTYIPICISIYICHLVELYGLLDIYIYILYYIIYNI